MPLSWHAADRKASRKKHQSRTTTSLSVRPPRGEETRAPLNVAMAFYRRERRHRDEWAPLDKRSSMLLLDGSAHASIAEVLGVSDPNVGTKLIESCAR